MRKPSLPRRRRRFIYCLLTGAMLCLIAFAFAAIDQRELAAGVMVAVLGTVWAAAVNFETDDERQRQDARIRTWRA
ncbi:MAG: hypothetical protein V3U43_05100 [Pseudomonadales bacterium]